MTTIHITPSQDFAALAKTLREGSDEQVIYKMLAGKMLSDDNVPKCNQFYAALAELEARLPSAESENDVLQALYDYSVIQSMAFVSKPIFKRLVESNARIAQNVSYLRNKLAVHAGCPDQGVQLYKAVVEVPKVPEAPKKPTTHYDVRLPLLTDETIIQRPPITLRSSGKSPSRFEANRAARDALMAEIEIMDANIAKHVLDTTMLRVDLKKIQDERRGIYSEHSSALSKLSSAKLEETTKLHAYTPKASEIAAAAIKVKEMTEKEAGVKARLDAIDVRVKELNDNLTQRDEEYAGMLAKKIELTTARVKLLK